MSFLKSQSLRSPIKSIIPVILNTDSLSPIILKISPKMCKKNIIISSTKEIILTRINKQINPIGPERNNSTGICQIKFI